MAKKIELLHTTYDESGNIESQEVVHPLTSPDCIVMENGKTLDEVMGDGIATPTLTHEGTSFKVGVGDSNIEVVDGDVAGMTLKGQSYQNILPKPTTLIMETDEKEFKINDKIDSNIIIDDNIAEIATVKGKTIVNTVQEESASEYTVLGEDLSGQSITYVKDQINSLDGMSLTNLLTKNPRNAGGTWYDLITINSEITDVNNDSYRIKDTDATQTLQPGTYLIQFKAVSVSGTARINSRTQLVNGSQVIQEEFPGGVSATVGINRIKINLTKECNRIGLYYNAGQNSSATITEVMVFKYDDNIYNLDIPYFEGEKYFESNIKGVTLQGQTLVNTIQEPCKDDYVVLGAEDGIEFGAETGGHGTIEDTVQGGINGAVLEGNTLINVAQEENRSYAGIWSYIYIKKDMFIEGKKYFVKMFNMPKRDDFVFDISNYPVTKYFSTDNKNDFTSFIYESTDLLVVHINNNGVSNITDDELIKIKVVIVEYQDGMENWDIPYFEGMQSVKMPVVKTTGRNLICVGRGYNDTMIVNGITVTRDVVNQTITFNGTSNNDNVSYSLDSLFTQKTKAGERYALSCYLVSGTADSISFRVSTKGWTDSMGCYMNQPQYRTFNQDKVFDACSFRIDNGATFNNAVFKVMFEKIDANSTTTSYEPYQSSTVTTEKNLFDGILTPDYLTDATGQPSGVSGSLTHSCYTPSYIPIQANEKFRLRVTSDGSTTVGDGRVYFYDKDYNYLNTYVTSLEAYTNTFSMDAIHTVPNNSNIAYMRVRFFNGFGVQADSVQINKVYELRGIGDVKDELDLQTGKLTQRVGEVVLDGSDDEGWSLATFPLISNNFTAYIPILNPLNNTDSARMRTLVKDNKGFTNKCVSATVNDSKMNGEKGFSIHQNGNIYFTLPLTECADITQWKKQLASQPLVVQYAIKPTIKTIDLQVTDQDNNTIPHIQTQPTVTHITASSDYLIPTVTINGNLAYDTIIKPSTLYTVRFKHDTVNTDNPLTVDLGGTTQTITSTEFTITTPSDLTHNQLVFSGKNNVVSEVQVIEGDMTNIEYPFFEGMNDVRITDTNRNVNLFDINDTVSGYLGGTGTEIKVPDHGNLTSNYIKVKPNTTYVYNHGGFVSNFAEYWTGMYFYQDDRGTESNLYTGGSHNRFVYTGQGKQYTNFKFTTPSDCEYIRIGSRGLSYDGAWATLYQLDNFDDSKFIARGKNLLMPSILNPVITNSTQNYAGVNFTYNSDGSFTMSGTFTSNITLHGNANEFIKLLKHGARYRTSEMMLMEVFSLDGNTRWTNDLTFDKNNHIRVSPYYQWNGVTGESINKTYYPQIEIGDSQTSYEPYKGVEVQQDVDSIPLTSDMFEQGTRERGMGFSMQQCHLSSNTTRISSKTLIPVKPSSKYTVLGINTSVNHIWGDMYDKDGLVCYDSVLDLTGGISSGTGVFVPHDVHYLCIKVKNADESAISPSNLDSMNLIIQEVPQEIVLRGIGSVKDELDLTRGEYIQRIGEMILDGKDYDNLYYTKYSMNDHETNTFTNTSVFCVWNIPNKRLGYNTSVTSSFSNCGTSSAFAPTQAKQGIYSDHTLLQNIYIDYGNNNNYTLQEFKTYLQTNPITLQYQLATPIIHKVNLTNTKVIPSYATETHYETITPSYSLIPNITIPSTLNYDVAIKPSTQYTIRANTQDALTVDLGGTIGTLSNGKVTLTTPATLTHNEVKFSGTGSVKELMVVEGNEIKDNVPFFNGMKDVQMGGIKLVNICRGMYTWNVDFITLNTIYNQFTFTDMGSYGNIQFDETLLKPHTTYTIYFNITENTSTIVSPIGVTLSQTNGKETSNYPTVSAKQTGIMSFVTTIDEVAKKPRFVVKSGSTNSKITIKNAMIIEGDWTHLDEIPFIESEMIIDQPIIRSQGKNLLDLETKYFNPSNVTYTKSGTTYTVAGNTSNYNYGQFAWTTADSWFRKLLGKEVTLSVSSISYTNANSKACIQVRMECADGSKVFKTISINDSIKYITFTIPSNAIDMALQLMSNNTGSPLDSESTLTVSNIQLVLGNTAASYRAYRHQTLYSNRVIGYEEGIHYVGTTGIKVTNAIYNSVMADVEGLSIAYVTNASSNFTFWDKDGVYISGKSYLDTSLSKDNTNGFIQVPSNAKYMKFVSGNTTGSTTDYTKATVTGELPLRSLPNGVCDTLNLVTGEYVQRVGEMVLDGSESWGLNNTNTKTSCYHLAKGHNTSLLSNMVFKTNSLSCNRYSQITQGAPNMSNDEGIFALSTYDAIYINSSIMSTSGAESFKQYLSQNPITVQYELATPIVRKLGFTTKGNYREQVLDGSETWAMDAIDNNITVRMTKKTVSPLQNPLYNTPLFTDDYHVRAGSENHSTYEYITCIGNAIYINIYQSKVKELSVQGCTQWLSQNPIKVGYITSAQSSESYSNIHKPIFFNDVNVQYLPNNVDIQPELTYQVRTRNSYVLDMAKSNTRYTIKALSNPRDFYIDGKSFGKGTNGCITTPTLTNRLLVTGSSDVKELMIIEGDVTGKNLPYFKGILSSYHDVDEIELYSVNKNLFDMSKVKPYVESGTHWWDTIIKENEVVSVRSGNIEAGQFGAYVTLDVRPNSVYTLYIEMEKDGEPFGGQIYVYENDGLWGNGTFSGHANAMYHLRTSHNAKYITIGLNYGKDFPIGTTLVSKNMRLYLGEESPVYIPHAHSTTLIEMPTRLETVKVVRPVMENGSINSGTGANYAGGDSLVKNVRTKDYLPVQPGEIIKFYNNGQGRAVNMNYYDINKQFVKYEFYDGTSTRPTVPKDCYFVRMYCGKSACSDITLTRQAYKPIQLNSLPNGVYDEIIMKPNSSKAQLVQRVGKVVLDGSGNHYPQPDKNGNMSFIQISGLYLPLAKGIHGLLPTHTYCDKLMVGNPHFKEEQGVPSDKSCVGVYQDFVRLCLHELDESEQVYRNYLQQNPLVIYYELDTPIIHEIQLKGYPHVYENGTVTLNTDTPHQTLVSYNVNQEQLISTQNETIIRHDQQIDDLYYYIEMYLEEIYQMELFRMKLELSL